MAAWECSLFSPAQRLMIPSIFDSVYSPSQEICLYSKIFNKAQDESQTQSQSWSNFKKKKKTIYFQISEYKYICFREPVINYLQINRQIGRQKNSSTATEQFVSYLHYMSSVIFLISPRANIRNYICLLMLHLHSGHSYHMILKLNKPLCLHLFVFLFKLSTRNYLIQPKFSLSCYRIFSRVIQEILVGYLF